MLSRGARHAPGHTVVNRTAHGDPEGGNSVGEDAIAGFHGSGGAAKAIPTLRHPAGLPLELGLVLFDKKHDLQFKTVQAVVAEFIATAWFLFFNITLIQFNAGINSTGGGKPDAAKQLALAFNFGFSIFVLVYTIFNTSGGNINPAITLTLVLGKRMSLFRGVLYVIAQITGACLGALCAKHIAAPGTYAAVRGGINVVQADVSQSQALLGEFLATMLLCVVVLAATTATVSQPGSIESQYIFRGAQLPLAIGVTVTICHFALIPVDNCSVNPARSFGASAVAHQWPNHWVFWVAPCLGSIGAILMWELFLRPEVPKAAAV